MAGSKEFSLRIAQVNLTQQPRPYSATAANNDNFQKQASGQDLLAKLMTCLPFTQAESFYITQKHQYIKISLYVYFLLYSRISLNFVDSHPSDYEK